MILISADPGHDRTGKAKASPYRYGRLQPWRGSCYCRDVLSWAGRLIVIALLLAVLVFVWQRPTTLKRVFQPASPYERYAASLREAGLAETALGRSWIQAGEQALVRAVRVALPFREAGYFAPTEAAAAGYQFRLRRGQQLIIECEVQAAEAFHLFLDVFRQGETLTRIASATAEGRKLQLEAEEDGTYIVRVQPELLRGGRFVLTQRVTASLAFPVPAAAGRVQSVFGDRRDAGKRRHEGVDIFAPRGTRAVAASDGVIRRVGTNTLGGNVVWLWDDSRGLSLYYAHLDRATVRPGARVRAGDTVGLIGNTGNARATHSHLHFGIYAFAAGALDPVPFVVPPRGSLPAIPSDLTALGGLRRVARPGASLRDGEDEPSGVPLKPHTVFRVDAASGARLRVRLPDGTSGFIARADTEPLAATVRRLTPPAPLPLLDRPRGDAAVMASVTPGEPLPVLGEFEGFLLVRDPRGQQGWIANP